MADQEVEEYLKAWGLDSYVESFREQRVTINALAVMSNDTARDIVPLAGDRAVLMFNLEQLRGFIQEKVLSEKATIEILDESKNQIILPSDQEGEQLPQLQDLTNESLSSSDNDLLELLERCSQGQALLNNY